MAAEASWDHNRAARRGLSKDKRPATPRPALDQRTGIGEVDGHLVVAELFEPLPLRRAPTAGPAGIVSGGPVDAGKTISNTEPWPTVLWARTEP